MTPGNLQSSVVGGAVQSVFADDQMRWSRLLLARASASRDPNNILVGSYAESGASSDITVLGGVATDAPVDGLAYFWPLRSLLGRRVTRTLMFDVRVVVEIVAPPGDTSDLYIVGGIADSQALASVHYFGGLLYDAAGGPDLRAGHHAAITTGAQDADTEAAHMEFLQGPNRALGVLTLGLDASAGYTNSTQRLGNSVWSDDLDVFIAIGRSTNIAGNATVKFRAYVAQGMRGGVFRAT